MKRTLLLTAAALSLSWAAHAQNECNPLKYALPQFSQGLIQLDDGSRQSGLFNVCIIDQSVRMISGQDTVLTASNDRIVKVTAGNKLFLKFQGRYIEAVEMSGDVMLCLMRSTTIVDNVREGGYGAVNATAFIESVSLDQAHNDVMIDRVLDDPANYRYEESFVLALGNKRYPFSQKSLIKCFPKQKDFINQYFTEHKADVKNRGEVLGLFLKLK